VSDVFREDRKVNVSIIIQIDPAHITSGEEESTPESDQEDLRSSHAIGTRAGGLTLNSDGTGAS
jgi:hypothetical protein